MPLHQNSPTRHPIPLGGTRENNQAQVTPSTNDVLRDSNGNLILHWRVTFKPTFTGPKSLWSRAEDQSNQSAGFTKFGEITLTDQAAKPAPNPPQPPPPNRKVARHKGAGLGRVQPRFSH